MLRIIAKEKEGAFMVLRTTGSLPCDWKVVAVVGSLLWKVLASRTGLHTTRGFGAVSVMFDLAGLFVLVNLCLDSCDCV